MQFVLFFRKKTKNFFLTILSHYSFSLFFLTILSHYSFSLFFLTILSHYSFSLFFLTILSHYSFSLFFLTIMSLFASPKNNHGSTCNTHPRATAHQPRAL